MVSAGMWVYRRVAMKRAYATVERPAVSRNSIRRQRRGRKNRKEAFLEPLGLNQGLRTYQPELVDQVETCDHPDYRQSTPTA